MRRGKMIGICPAVALATSAIFASTAAAAPHWYLDGVRLPEGKGYPTMTWGVLMFDDSNPSIPPGPNCAIAALGSVENPTDGGAGIGAMEEFVASPCLTGGGGCEEGMGLESGISSYGLPWSIDLAESGNNNLLEIRGMNINPYCNGLGEPQGQGSFLGICDGNSDPEFDNGSGNLSQVVSKLIFTGEIDRLSCDYTSENGETITEGILEKSLKMMAYGPVPAGSKETSDSSQSTLEVKNP